MDAEVSYVDHSVFITTKLDEASALYEALGFTLSPRSVHMASPTPGAPLEQAGTANRCAYFGRNYIEVLGFIDPNSRDPWRVKPLIDIYEGIRGITFGCGDADTVAQRLEDNGVVSSGVLKLEREVDTPEGPRLAEFRTILWPFNPERQPEGNVLVAEHLTPEYIHQERYLTHPNGATELTSMLLVVDDGDMGGYIDRYTAVVGFQPVTEGHRTIFQLSPGRLEIIRASSLSDVLPGETAPTLPFWAAQTVTVKDIGAARSIADRGGVDTHSLPNGFFVRAGDAFGASLVFLGQ